MISKYQESRLLKTLSWALPILTHILAIAVYVIPLYYSPRTSDKVLDEIHILDNGFSDVRGTSPLFDLLLNDYWGRPMSIKDSHKSWRPFSILTFRWLNSNGWGDQEGNFLLKMFGNRGDHHVFFHRFINVLIHASLSEAVSIIACQIIPSNNAWLTLAQRTITKILCALHPAHVEAVANAANRPHIMALLASMVAVDDRSSLVVTVLAFIVGLITAETFIFQMPAILVTMIAIKWRKGKDKKLTWISLRHTVVQFVPRITAMVGLTMTYLGGRYYFNTLDINYQLIRKAENAFFNFTGLQRYLSFAWVTAYHIGKAFTVDPIGQAHEYGFDCVRPISDFSDLRLVYPFGIMMSMLSIGYLCLRAGPSTVMHFLVFTSWLATLFPISGIIRVGTFISDRLTVAASFVFCVFVGKGIVIAGSHSRRTGRFGIYLCLLSLYLSSIYQRTHVRTLEWTNNVSLLESGLRVCPRSSKMNLEASKLYSGLIPKLTNFSHSELLINRAEEIDPDYCDVHWQWIQILFPSIKENGFRNTDSLLNFESRLMRAVMCPFGGSSHAQTFFQQYWVATTKKGQDKAAVQRYNQAISEITLHQSNAQK